MNNQMKSPTGLLGKDDGEQVEELDLRELVPFANHPFQVLEDESMYQLMASIQENGVAVPIIVRPKGRGSFEIIAGHRRTKACQLLGLQHIPAFIRDLEDDEAVLYMVDTNIQREALLFSEKAFAYKMKMDALKSQGKRNDLTSDPVGQKSEENTSDPLGQKLTARELLAKNTQDSGMQIQRYIRLTQLEPDLLRLVDMKKLPFQTAVELSYLKKEEQAELHTVMQSLKTKPTLDQAKKIRKYSMEAVLNEKMIEAILDVSSSKPVKLSLKADMRDYFPENTSKEDMEYVILELLKSWVEKKE